MDERDFKDYWTALTAMEKRGLADACDTSVNYLTQIAHGHRAASPAFARTIHEKSDRAARLSSLRADIWPAPANQLEQQGDRRDRRIHSGSPE